MSLTLQNTIADFFKNNFAKLPKTIAVAVSGGSDSLALTLLLNEFCHKNKIKLIALTVDHKMRKSSSDEALQLNTTLKKYKINHQILTIDVKKIPKSNIEANLREARYDLLYDYCIANKIADLFLAHIKSDLAENFLIRLFRGSQVDGLSAMTEVVQFKKIKLLRPLITAEKEMLQNYLQTKKIKWFEDESNQDEKFLRNKIRKFLNSFEDKNLIIDRIVDSSRNITKTKEFIDEILLEKAENCLEFGSDGSFVLNLEAYKNIAPKIALKILSLVLIEVSGDIYKPRLKSLEIFHKDILNLKKSQKKNFYGCMALSLANQELLIYRDENEEKKPTQKFDEKFDLIDGRFLVEKSKKAPYKFYFRTILGNIFK